MAVCGIKYIDLTKDAIKNDWNFFSYNKNIEPEPNFFSSNSNYIKIKHGVSKNVIISGKISSFKCPWVKKLHDQKPRDWKLIPIYFINNALSFNFSVF